MRIGCIIQARNTSARLPGKVMLPLPLDGSVSVLENVINRVKKVNRIDTIIVATTTNSDDDSICELASNLNVNCYRGSEMNVLSRFYESAVKYNLDVIIRITSDCPCLDYEVLAELLEFHLEHGYDYSSNALTRTLPHGMDAEVLSFKALSDAFLNSTEKYEMEHVTPYIYRTNPDKYLVGIFTKNYVTNCEKIRITLDTKQDYLLLAAVFDYLKDIPFFLVKDIIELFESKPWLYEINNNVTQKKIFDNLVEEIDEAKVLLEKQELFRVVAFIEECSND